MLLKKRQEQLYEKVITANFQPQLFKTKEQVLENIQTKEALLVDARSTDRFLETEELSWIESGHIQFNKYSLYATTERRKILPKEALKKYFQYRETTNIHLWIRCNSLY
jgi:thiosulfate/3-mercaptopyruvate sulfurtransferase